MTLEQGSPNNKDNLEVTRDNSQMISQYRLNQNASRFIKRIHHQRSISHVIGLSASNFGTSTNLNDYGSGPVTLDSKDLSQIMHNNLDISNSPSLNFQPGTVVTETVPYVLSKDGPNAHLFKFQTVKRVNHVHNLLYRNISKQHRESLQLSKDSYASFLATQKRKPYLSNYNTIGGGNEEANRNISSQNSHYHNRNPLVSDVTGLSTQFDEHELQKSMIL